MFSMVFLRIVLNFIVGFIVVMVVMPKSIQFLKKLKFGQVEREEGLASHKAKGGTPTMGGIVFILASIVVVYVLNFSFFQNPYVNLLTFAFLGFGLIGFLDDYLIVVRKTNEGLKPIYKYALQSVAAIAFYLLAKYFIPDFNSMITIPLLHMEVDLGWFYPVLVYFMFTAGSNAVNLTDGLDGLATGLSITATSVFVIFAIMNKNYEIAIYAMVIVGALLGFMYFNYHPARIFMGDTGSLALGGVLAALAVLTHQELLFILIGGVFLIETLSVIIQVVSFKTRGKRVFKMAPIHHHFEMLGWSEQQVVISFWFLGFICGIISIVLGVM
ncbi:MAG: phospho-N-acetylmuramoyl-pentapeptide-transferase [Longibaculum muris]|uniref:Phospho-N-acetylmuramoyl-pentapeptide-transferase n=1 Tax=Longibaculum muris TaxID=1796628 RepID=A0A4V2W5U7_9FIRM|nr:phospho-N-acetylmuramoyl-pentapeptide-transferase [Longibaculum muris]KXU50770.1 phospho-N-acetylmuramoyl-pentapeptide-transferase [Candidatus Stoquefichus sp. KLE1796]MBS5369899.1 phospho-N-acetylmuramoyl-pentapeptide-transferase [Coprobacillus cateniformis]MCR1887374.1 phospho-N-acetylmuramoyl-pentapeptide-transferase [Longibaculum muris]MED9812245.1 phospho-N-acetylmuramoyl-pentapeptide-transferase [Longibaculum muris]TCW02051.1 phospho-N-acetylmuramoyl-pentapeptide-transferase [Longibac